MCRGRTLTLISDIVTAKTITFWGKMLQFQPFYFDTDSTSESDSATVAVNLVMGAL